MSNAKTNLPNPKDLLGVQKVPFTCFPAAGQIHGSMAMEDGEFKYGFMNWREHPVKARIYIDAMKRHIAAWEDGEETAQDSLVHHLGHVIACAAILLDAQEVGNLIDDRSKSGKTADLLNRMSEVLKQKQAERAAKAEQNVDAKLPTVRTTPAQGSPKDSAEVPVRLDMGQLNRWAQDVRTSRFESSVEEPTRPRVPNGF